MKNITVTDIRNINTILDYVHDRIFDLSKIRYEEKLQTLSIPLTIVTDDIRNLKKAIIFKTWENPVVEATLVVKHAIGCVITDDAKIDQGVVNTITLEDDILTIRCSVPVEIKAKVTKLDLELVVSNTAVSSKKRFTLASRSSI